MLALSLLPVDESPELPPLWASDGWPTPGKCCQQAERWKAWSEWFASARLYQPWQERFAFDDAATLCRELHGTWELIEQVRLGYWNDCERRENLAILRCRIGWAAFDRGELPPMVRCWEMALGVKWQGGHGSRGAV